MLILSIPNVYHFLDLTNFIHTQRRYYNRMNFKYSWKSFSTIVSSSSPTCIIELQIMPQYFPFFFCNNHIFQYSTISLTQFYPTLFLMKHNGFPVVIFSLRESLDHLLDLTFLTSSGHNQWQAYLPLLLSYQEFDVGVINYGSFVSIDSVQFLACLTMISDTTYVTVTVCNSHVKLSGGGENPEYFVLSQQRRECIIGGVAAEDVTQFVIIFNPIPPFFNLISGPKAKRVWLFKSNDNIHGIITVPIDLYARYLLYSA